MRFWDSSAVVPLVCREVQSPRCRTWLQADPVIIVWAFTAAEVLSALCRKRREGRLESRSFAAAKARLHKIEQAWNEVVSYDAVRVRARRLLETHPLSAADALQLAAALVMTEERPTGTEFVTFDVRLAEAANKEGFPVLPG
jgi:predicted nucleic acid-binding protein